MGAWARSERRAAAAIRGTRVKRLRKLHARLAELTGNTPTKMSFRRIKAAHYDAMRAGFAPKALHAPLPEAQEAGRL
jgi:hypothetical protein